MQRVILTLLPRVLAILLALGASTAQGAIIYKSATMGEAGQGGGFALNANQFLGSRFQVDEAVEVRSIGGHLVSSSGTLFGTIVSLSGPDAFPSGAPFDGTTIASVTFAVGSPSFDFRAGLSVTLERGNYALIFGSEDPIGFGSMPTNNTDVPGASYFRWNGSRWWPVAAPSGLRFVLEDSFCGNGILETPGEACDDANAEDGDGCDRSCQIEQCFTCVGEPSGCGIVQGAPCDDGNACTTDDRCDGSATCMGGPPPDCDDDIACTVDSCAEPAGCLHTEDDASCEDANQCTMDSCDANAGCRNLPLGDGTSCSNGDLCDGEETCQGGTCMPGAQLDCNDGNDCTDESCHPTSGCLKASMPDGTACTPIDDCTAVGACLGSACEGIFTAFPDVDCSLEQLLSVTCDGKALPKNLQKFIAKKVKRARSLLGKANKAALKGKGARAERFKKRAKKRLDAIPKKTRKAERSLKLTKHISGPCKDKINGIVSERQGLIVGMES